MWVEPRDFAIVRLNSYDDECTLLYHVTFDNYVAINGFSYPRQIVVTSSVPQEIRAVIKIYRLSVASETGKTLFDLPVPPGITPRYLE